MVRRNRQVTSYASAEKNSLHLDVFVDRSVLEVFVDGRAAFAARIYPTLPGSLGVGFLAASTGARVERLTVARLKSSVLMKSTKNHIGRVTESEKKELS
jgi:sucrose-6-phosphate hydrolase SacC (GH32 family)